MKRWLSVAVLMFSFSGVAGAQDQFPSYSGAAANRPNCVRNGLHYTITDAPSTSDCTTTGGGSSVSECVCKAGTWTSAASGGGGSVSSVTCGTGLTGGTITTTGTCAVSFGTTSTTVAAGNSTINGARGAKYDPDRRPSGCDNGTSVCDEFIGGFQQSWSQFQGGHGETWTAAQDTALLQLTTQTAAHLAAGHAIALPTGVDWLLCAKAATWFNSTNNQGGILVSVGGTLAAPATFYGVRVVSNSTIDAAHGTSYAPGNGFTVLDGTLSSGAEMQFNTSGSDGESIRQPLHLRMRYNHTSKALVRAYSWDGLNWKEGQSATLTTTLASDPLYAGGWLDDDTTTTTPSVPLSTPLIRFYFFRVLTDATSTASPYPCGS